MSQAEELARVGNLYFNVGDELEDIDQATQHLVSIMKAFDIEAEDMINVVDELNEVGNNFATTSGGIGEGLMRSSAVLSQAGASLEESIAMFTAAQEIIQNAESVGTAWRTVSLRLRGAKAELED